MSTVNLSRERRRLAVRMVRGEGILTHPDLSPDAQLLYTVGVLCANDSGFMAQDDLTRAMNDPEIVNVARQIMRKAATK